MDAKAIASRAYRGALVVITKIGWPIALGGALFFGGEIRSFVSDFQEFRKYGPRGREGVSVQATETKESRKAEKTVAEATLPPERVKQIGRATAPIVGRRYDPETAKRVEGRVQLDIDGDGLVNDVPAAEVDKQKREEGGKAGRLEAEQNPAGDPYQPITSAKIDATGSRDATVDVLWNQRTGEFVTKVKLEELKRLRWIHETWVRARVPLDQNDGWKPTLDEWTAEVGWAPFEFGKRVPVRLAVDWRRDRIRPPDGMVLVNSKSGARVSHFDSDSYGLNLLIYCKSVIRLDCSP